MLVFSEKLIQHSEKNPLVPWCAVETWIWLVVSNIWINYFPFHIWDVIPTPLTKSIIFFKLGTLHHQPGICYPAAAEIFWTCLKSTTEDDQIFIFFHRVQVGWAQGSGWEWRDFWTILAGLCALWLRNEWKNVTMEHGDSFAGVLKVDVVKNPCQFKCRWYRYVLIEMYTTLHIHTLRSIALRSNTMLCYTRQHNTRQYNTIQHNTNVRVFVE